MSILTFDCRFQYTQGFALDFAFDSGGAVTALVGPSGCGKTTVLNLIAGLLRPTSGDITLCGRTLFSTKKRIALPPEQREIGYVFQDYQLFPHLTVEENLRFGARRAAEPRIEFAPVADVLRLGDLLTRYPAALSGGQKQRVALARAILCSPRLLLLDEPLSAVDAAHRVAIEEFLTECIRRFEIPALLVSHDSQSVDRLADTMIPIGAGR